MGDDGPVTAEQVLDAVRAAHGEHMVLEGRCPGGEVGAHYARTSDGHRVVFKWSEDPGRLGELSRMVERVERLRAKGYPAPRYHLPVAFDGGVAVFQDAVDGEWRDDIDAGLVETALMLNDMQAGGADQRTGWRDYIVQTLTEGADGYCLHETLRNHSPETRLVLEWVESVGKSVGALPCDDLVHLDFHHRNMLRVGHRLSAVVDWEGCMPGDRAFDLITFSFGFTHAQAAPEPEQQVWARAEEIATAEQLTAYAAHMSLRRLDWSIRHHTDSEVVHLLTVVNRYRARLP